MIDRSKQSGVWARVQCGRGEAAAAAVVHGEQRSGGSRENAGESSSWVDLEMKRCRR